MKNIHLQLKNLIGQIESAMIQASIIRKTLVFNHFGTVSAIVGVWFGAMCVSGVGDPLPKRQTIGICDGHEDLSSC